MAITNTVIGRNVVGDVKEVIIESVLSGAATSGIVNPPLSWIDDIENAAVELQDSDVDVYPNSDTASTTQDDQGQFFFQNATADSTHRFLVRGR